MAHSPHPSKRNTLRQLPVHQLPPFIVIAVLVAGCAAVSVDTKSIVKGSSNAKYSATSITPDTVYDSGVRPTAQGPGIPPVNGVRIIQNGASDLTIEVGWDKDGPVRFTLQDIFGKEQKLFTEGAHARGTMRFHLSKANDTNGEYYFVLQTQGKTWKTKIMIAP